jgi:PHP family Zn ribbon phosphoesterase
MINELGTEFEILIDKEIEEIKKFDEEIAMVIEAIRNNKVEYTPGGGGTYGQIQLEL